MAYSELIKNFEKIRGYMREFYVYGFKSREEFDNKSLRSYDDEKRRVESWLKDYMSFRQTADGKSVFLSIDSRLAEANPLFKAWKAKSFTDIDIALHFIIFDILYDDTIAFTIKELLKIIDCDYLSNFPVPMTIDESTLRKKLKEYANEGIIEIVKIGKTVVYRRKDSDNIIIDSSVLNFYSEVAPCGVIGSYILDKTSENNSIFSFKHHYITQTLDSGVMCDIFNAISQKKVIELTDTNRKNGNESVKSVVPLQIFISVQNGRQYIMASDEKYGYFQSFRLDYIKNVTILGECSKFDMLREKLSQKRKHMWGVKFNSKENTEHVEFTLFIGDNEDYVYRRLLREKRCGTVTKVEDNIYNFTADVYDTYEMLPWIRTFTGRILSMNFSNRTIENRLKSDFEEMCRIYEVK